MKSHSPILQPVRTAVWHARARRYLAAHPAERDAIMSNSILRDKHYGKRCFILGNGPSLLDDDLSVLDGEILFTVNNLDAMEIGAPMPQYHVISDRRFFSMDVDSPTDRAMVERLVRITSKPGGGFQQPPTTFVPSSEIGRMETFASGRSYDFRYFCNPYYFSDFYELSTDISQVIPRFSSVIQHAVIIAMHLGFKKIYLLGCDTTNIVANVQTALEQSVADSYAYAVTHDIDQWLREQYLKRDMERCAESFLEVLVAFRFLSTFCRRRGVDLVNCSSKTIVESIARSPLPDIL